MSCWSEIYIPNTTYESCDWTETWQALPVTVRGIIYTKKCPTDAEYDFEKLVLCEKTTGNKVLVESRTNVNDPAQARTTRYTYLATNTAFTGNPDTDLEDCSVWEKLDIQTEQYCDGWETVRGTLVWEVTSLTPNLLWIVFHKVDWTTHTPVAPVEWACVVAVPNRQVDVLEDCAWTTTATDVSWNVAQEVILSGSTKAIPVRVEECETQVLADHANGCIERTTLGTPSCTTSNESFAFTATDFIDFTVLSNDWNGNYTVVQTMMPSAHAWFLALANAVSIPDTRTVLDIAWWALILDLHNANFSNVVDLSPTSVQLDLHYEPGVTDTPIPLTAPCTDPVADSSYISSWAILRSIYDSYPIGIPQPNWWNTITYTLTHYTSVPSLLVEHIPAKQVINYDINGLPISDRYFEQSTLAEIVFDPATDVFKNVCTGKQTADIPNCDLTTTPTEVDSITATYILNQNNKHTEQVYDVVDASLTWSIVYNYTAPLTVSLDITWVISSNDSMLFAWTDFGDWYNDVWLWPSHTYTDWSYEIKTRAVMSSWNKLLLNAKEIIINNWVITYLPAWNTSTVNRTYKVEVWCALQDYCDWTIVWSTYNADWSAYTLLWSLDLCTPIIIDELEDNANAEWETCNLYPITTCFCAMVSGSATKRESAKEAVSTKPVKASICKTLRYNCDRIVVDTTYTISGKPYTSAQFALIKYTVIDCNAPTPTYSAGAVTCTTYPDPIDWIVVLNATVYTNDSNPSDVQTIYTLASTYPTVGNIWDLYIVADEDLLVDCPPWSIIETELCYKALVDIKWIAVAWDTINIQSIENVTAWTTRYTIKHVGSWAIIYAGIDPLTDIGIDPDAMNPVERNVTPCVPTPVVYGPIDTKEICAFVNWGTQQYCLTRVFSRHPQTGVMTILHYEDSQGNIIDWDVVETCCDWSAVCYSATPSVFRVKDYYSVNSDSFLSNLWSPAPTTYSYRVTNVVVNWTALSWYPITSTAWTSSSNTIVPTQVAPYNTIPAYQNLWGWQRVASDANWINFLNSLSIPFFTFQLSPLEETLDWLSIAWGYWFGNPIDSTLVYWDWFQIVYPDWYTFSITVEALYDGVLWHTMVFTESSNIIDGASMTGAPTTWLIF